MRAVKRHEIPWPESLVGNWFRWDDKEVFSTDEIFKAYLKSQVINGEINGQNWCRDDKEC